MASALRGHHTLACVTLIALATFFGCSPGNETAIAIADGGMPAASTPEVSAAICDAVDRESRPQEDRARDGDRKPGEVLAFFAIEPGMRVAELMAGAGYYTEILSDVVGPEGQLYAHNNPFVLDRYAREPFGKRLARMNATHVAALDTELHDLLLPRDLDAVLLIRFYHDLYWIPGPDGEMGSTDRAVLNRQVFEALRPGGIYGVVDHHAETGSGARDAVDPREGLHRVDRDLVVREIEAAGFVLEAESDVLARPEDRRDWYIFVDDGARRDKTDRFVLRFRKPGS